MRVQYTGNSPDGVIVPDLGEYHAEPGVPFEVSDEVGAALLEQIGTWMSADHDAPVPAEGES